MRSACPRSPLLLEGRDRKPSTVLPRLHCPHLTVGSCSQHSTTRQVCSVRGAVVVVAVLPLAATIRHSVKRHQKMRRMQWNVFVGSRTCLSCAFLSCSSCSSCLACCCCISSRDSLSAACCAAAVARCFAHVCCCRCCCCRNCSSCACSFARCKAHSINHH